MKNILILLRKLNKRFSERRINH